LKTTIPTQSNTRIVRDSPFVGINCNAPQTNLDVRGSVQIWSDGNIASENRSSYSTYGYGTGIDTLILKTSQYGISNSNSASILFTSSHPQYGFGRIVGTDAITAGGTWGGDLVFETQYDAQMRERMRILGNGNIQFGDLSANGTTAVYHSNTPTTYNFYGTGVASNLGGVLSVFSTQTYAIGNRGSINLGTRSTDFGGGNQHQYQARISGVVESSYNGAFTIDTNSGGGMVTRFKIDSGGSIFFTYYNVTGALSITDATSGRIGVTSDRRAKTNITYMTEPATEKLLALKPARYAFKTSPTVTHLGFIAQDVETIIPEAVDGKKYEYQWEINEDGTPKLDSNSNLIFTDRERHRGFSDRPVIATLVKGFQELVERVKVLEAKLASQTPQ
jgi:hypothetical protein